MLKISIIIAVYQSHEIVRRQLLHLNRIKTDDTEIIIVDDNSNPPLEGARLNTHSPIRWNVGVARNMGVEVSRGEYLFFTDIDHIISKEALEDALNFTGNKMIFRRQIAVLDENGFITQDERVLKDWGWRGDELDASVHGNTFVMRRDVFEGLGGFKEHLTGKHPTKRQGIDTNFNHRWNKKYDRKDLSVGRDIYHYPISRFNKDNSTNPKGMFYEI
jgi:glycosyltransferase involved in cell wall biosynthesis